MPDTADMLRYQAMFVPVLASRLGGTNKARSMPNALEALRRQVFQIMLLTALALPTPSLAAAVTGQVPSEQEPTESSLSGRAFRAKYVKGDAWFTDDERLKVSVGKQRIVLESEAKRKGPLHALASVADHSNEPNAAAEEARGPFSIPLAAVTEVSHSGMPEHLADKVFGSKPFYEPCAAGGDPRWAAVCLPPALVLWAGLQPFASIHHLVRIAWRESGQPESEIVLQVSKGDFREFLADLQTATGKPWVDKLPKEEEEVEGKTQARVEVQPSEPVNEAEERVRLKQLMTGCGLNETGTVQMSEASRPASPGSSLCTASQERDRALLLVK